MSYRKFSEKILAGSVNLLASADKLQSPDALDLQNWKVDQSDALHTRAGSTSIGTAGSNPIRTLFKFSGTRYQASDAIYRAFSSVSTGWSGDRIGVADMTKWSWWLNRSKSGKDDGTNFRNFSITAPASACVAADGTEYAQDITTFDNSETFVVDPSGDDSFDGSEKKQGTHSLLIEATEDTTYSITRTVSLDLSTLDGQTASDDDKHRIWIYASKFKRIEKIIFKIDVSSTAGAYDNYYEATIPRKMLKKAGKGWARFELRRAEKLNADGVPVDNLPVFRRVGGDTARSWATVTQIQIVLDTRTGLDVRFDLWDVFGSVAATIEGQDIEYKFTYANDSEHESNPSPISTSVVINKTSVALSSLTASADAQVTKKYIYRRGGLLPDFYRVSATGVANATTTYTDTNSDEDVLALGIILEDDNDAPPAAKGLAGPYFGRLVAWSTSTNVARLFWSKLDKPFAWPGAANSIEGNWENIGSTTEEIVWCTHRQTELWIYKENTIWTIGGDPDDGSNAFRLTSSPVGLIGVGAVCRAGDVDYFQAKEGIYRFNGHSAVKVSTKLDPIFKGLTTTIATGITIPAIDSTNRANSVIEFINDRVYFSYPSSGQTNPDTTVVYDIGSDRWYRDSRGYTSLYYEGQNGNLVGGRSNGNVQTLETGTDDAGSGIPVIWQSRYFDAGIGDQDKTFEDITIDALTNGVTVTATAYLNDANGGQSSVSLGTLSTAAIRTRNVLRFPNATGAVGLTTNTGRNISIRLTATGVVSIYDCILNGYLEARQAESYDSDEFLAGNGKMTRMRELLLDIDNAASVTVTVRSDQPSFAMADRTTNTVALSTTRRVERVMLGTAGGGTGTPDPRGYMHRVFLSGNDFRFYGGMAVCQIIGTWLNGTKGEFYKSDPVAPFGERTFLIKEIQVDCDLSGGTCAMTLETNQPGDVLASRTGFSPSSISATSGEQSVKIRCPGTFKGNLMRLTLTPASGAEMAIYAIRAWIKPLGLPNAGSWTWYEFPIEPTQDGILVPLSAPLQADEIG